MKNRLRKVLQQLTVTLGMVLLLSSFALGVLAEAPVPKPPKPQGKTECVEPTDVMRKRHMEFLLHQRDETVHRGIRTKKHSFKECIDCHVVYDDGGQAVSHLNPKHFCMQCHDYASVKIDCFDCHASKPRNKPSAANDGMLTP